MHAAALSRVAELHRATEAVVLPAVTWPRSPTQSARRWASVLVTTPDGRVLSSAGCTTARVCWRCSSRRRRSLVERIPDGITAAGSRWPVTRRCAAR